LRRDAGSASRVRRFFSIQIPSAHQQLTGGIV
jgi:hypothetical protein